MKVVILAGGMGTRLAEETEIRPKPMVEIGGRPILWHIMKLYGHHGFGEFAVALGYKGEVVKRWFLDYHALNGSMSVDVKTGRVTPFEKEVEDWIVHLVETGHDTNTGGRVKRLAPLLAEDTFMLTYGDGLADVDLGAVLRFHRDHGKLATVTAVRPPARFGGLSFDGDLVRAFTEKPQAGEGWVNGGFMVLEPGVLDYLSDDASNLERDGLERLAADGELAAFRHVGFWQGMDTLRDKRFLDDLWKRGAAPWKLWP